MEPQVALLRQTRSENLTPATCQPGEQMLTRIGELVRRVMAWRRRRRGRQAADLLWHRTPNGHRHAPPSPTTTR